MRTPTEEEIAREKNVFIEEFIEGGRIVRKTANGIDIPVDSELLPAVITHRFVVTKEEFKNLYPHLAEHLKN